LKVDAGGGESTSRAAADGREWPRARGILSQRDGRAGARVRDRLRNRDDGSVEIVAEGDRNALEIFAAWARRGPTSARVEDLRIEWSDAGDEFERFKIR
jgi:acylphosphatase